jgi:hypothetical protein
VTAPSRELTESTTVFERMFDSTVSDRHHTDQEPRLWTTVFPVHNQARSPTSARAARTPKTPTQHHRTRPSPARLYPHPMSCVIDFEKTGSLAPNAPCRELHDRLRNTAALTSTDTHRVGNCMIDSEKNGGEANRPGRVPKSCMIDLEGWLVQEPAAAFRRASRSILLIVSMACMAR